MNKTPITRKSQGIRALPFPMKSSRQQRLPLSVQGISQLLRKSDDAAQEDFGTHMDWTIGKTPFVLYCAEHDPQGMIQHAVAALQIGHTLLWHEPSYRQDSQIAFDIEGIGSFELSPRSYYKHIGVFLHAHGSTSTEMKIRLPSPDLWPSLGLAWLLHPPHRLRYGRFGGLHDQQSRNSFARPVSSWWHVHQLEYRSGTRRPGV